MKPDKLIGLVKVTRICMTVAGKQGMFGTETQLKNTAVGRRNIL